MSSDMSLDEAWAIQMAYHKEKGTSPPTELDPDTEATLREIGVPVAPPDAPISHADRYKHRIAEACEALHMSGNGSADPLPEADRAELVSFLSMRLATWQKAPRFSAAYDAAYAALIEATLAEVEADRAEERDSVERAVSAMAEREVK